MLPRSYHQLNAEAGFFSLRTKFVCISFKSSQQKNTIRNTKYIMAHHHSWLCVYFAKSPLLQTEIVKASYYITAEMFAFPGTVIYHSIRLMLCAVSPISVIQESEARLCRASLHRASAADLPITCWYWWCCVHSIHCGCNTLERFHSSKI